MKQIHELIIDKIKAEFEHNELKLNSTEFDTNVWVLAVATVPFEEEIENSAFLPYNLRGAEYYEEEKDSSARDYNLSRVIPTHLVRVVLGMSSSFGPSMYVDGTDVYLTVNTENQTAEFVWEEVWVETAPKFQGGTVSDALKWIKQMVEPHYIQLTDPFSS